MKREADNATAAAFRSAELCVVDGSDGASGALVAPMMAHGGCVGVLAIEVQNRTEQLGSVRALVTIFAAQLARWIPTSARGDARLPAGMIARAALFVALLAVPALAFAQTDEIQVYDGGLAPVGVFNLTLHNNFTPKGLTARRFPARWWRTSRSTACPSGRSG